MIWWILGAVALIAAAVLLISYVCFRMAFFVDRRKRQSTDIQELYKGEIYKPHLAYLSQCAQELRAMPCKEMETVSFDGLKLYGRYYEYAPGAPIELMMHGYRGSAERDLGCGVHRAYALGHSVLLVDQRCSGRSGGKVITFGIREHKDCLSWIARLEAQFGPDVRIMLTGISMGAATVLLAAGQPLPSTVVGVLADCGYTSPKEIIRVVIRKMKLPAGVAYFFVKLGARLYGGFDLEECAPIEAVKKATVPVLFFHGEADNFVPCEMSQRNFDACASRKKLVTSPDAGHALCFPMAKERYLDHMGQFFGF